MENKDNNKFEFNYSAPTEEERREIESIRRAYTDKRETTEGKLERLRRLDGTVKNTATCVGLIAGIVGLLIFGLGMTCVLEWSKVVLGVILGVVGLAPILLAYPLYKSTLNHYKKKHAEEILRLTEELLKKK